MSVMEGVREYTEGCPVELTRSAARLVIKATNEGGNNVTEVDLLDLLDWIKRNDPEILER